MYDLGHHQVMSLTDMQNSAFGLPSELPAGTTDVPLLLYLAHESVRDHDGEVRRSP